MALTPKQQRLLQEIQDIASFIDMDPWNIEHYAPHERTTRLGLMQSQLVRSQVITRYTLLDEFLTSIICRYFFPKGNFIQLWRTKKFAVFVHHIMDETYLLKKLGIVRAIMVVPKDVSSALARINDVRNDLAHSFFPENRKRYATQKRTVLYNGANLYSTKGIEKFERDFETANAFLVKKVYGSA